MQPILPSAAKHFVAHSPWGLGAATLLAACAIAPTPTPAPAVRKSASSPQALSPKPTNNWCRCSREKAGTRSSRRLAPRWATRPTPSRRDWRAASSSTSSSRRPGARRFIKEGKAVAGSRVDLVRSTIGFAVKGGAPKPDISTVPKLKQALLDAKSIAYSASASGTYFSTNWCRSWASPSRCCRRANAS